MGSKTQSDEVQALLLSGRQLYQIDRYHAALDAFTRILALEPKHVDALNMAAVAALQDGDLGRALGFLDEAILHHPSHPQAYSNLGYILERHGRLEEAANAYRASLEADAEQVLAWLNLANVLAEQGQFQAATDAYNMVLQRDPANVDALNNKGLALKEAGEFTQAEAILREAVRVAPHAEQAWINLGLVLRVGGKPQEALEAYGRALRLNPTSFKALNNLAVLHRWEGNLDEAEAICRSILKTEPDVIETLNNLGDILQAQGRLAEARSGFERVLAIDPNHPEAHHNLAVLLLLEGDFKNGWKHYEWRWLAKEFPSERRNFPQPLWTGEDFSNRTILLYVEQGLGDAIQFIRYAPEVCAQGGKVLVECPKSLKRLFETVPGIERVIARGDALPDFDVQCPFLSLPALLSPDANRIPATTPYLSIPEELAGPWHTRVANLGEGMKVGLVWAGSPLHTNDRERSIPLETYAPMAVIPGCTFFSLQIGPSASQLKVSSWSIVDLTKDVGDYMDTAALVAEMDLIITVDTSVAHVAGALGKLVWVLLPHAPDWRWQIERTDSPWYPTMTLYRQPRRRDWESVMQRVLQDLRTLAASWF